MSTTPPCFVNAKSNRTVIVIAPGILETGESLRGALRAVISDPDVDLVPVEPPQDGPSNTMTERYVAEIEATARFEIANGAVVCVLGHSWGGAAALNAATRIRETGQTVATVLDAPAIRVRAAARLGARLALLLLSTYGGRRLLQLLYHVAIVSPLRRAGHHDLARQISSFENPTAAKAQLRAVGAGVQADAPPGAADVVVVDSSDPAVTIPPILSGSATFLTKSGSHWGVTSPDVIRAALKLAFERATSAGG